MSASNMRDAALTLAAQGFRVFPLPSGQKAAKLPKWQQLATTGREQIAEWWPATDPAPGVAIATGRGLLVLDEDPRHGSAESIDILQLSYELPATRTARTPSGGRHRYYRVPTDRRVPNSTSKLGAGLDIRGDGGYVVAPPTVLLAGERQSAGKYEWESDAPIADAPDWLVERATEERAAKPNESEPSTATPAEIRPHNLTLADAAQMLEHLDAHRDDYEPWAEVLWTVRRLALGAQDGSAPADWFALLDKWSSGSPKYTSSGDVAAKWTEADKRSGYGASEFIKRAEEGGWVPTPEQERRFMHGLPTAEEMFGAPTGPVTVGSDLLAPAPTNAERFRPIPAYEFAAVAPMEYLVEDVVPQAPFGMVFGRSGSGKTFFTLDLAAAIARGEPWRGKAVKQANVVYICAEGPGGFRKRLRAYALHQGVKLEDVPLAVIGDAPNLREVTDCSDLISALRTHGDVGLIVVDTLSATTPGANENSGEDMGPVLEHCKAIHRATGATVLLIHHSGKDEARGARGWSGIKAAVDFEIEVTREFDDRCATVSKMRDDDDGAKYPFKLLRVLLNFDAKPLTSCVIKHVSAEDTQERGHEKLGTHERRVLATLSRLAPIGGDIGVAVDEVITAVVAETPFDPQKTDRRRDCIKRAIENLIERGRLLCKSNTLFLPTNVDSPAPGTGNAPVDPLDFRVVSPAVASDAVPGGLI